MSGSENCSTGKSQDDCPRPVFWPALCGLAAGLRLGTRKLLASGYRSFLVEADPSTRLSAAMRPRKRHIIAPDIGRALCSLFTRHAQPAAHTSFSVSTLSLSFRMLAQR